MDEVHTVKDVCENKTLWYKIHVLVYDLRHYNAKHASRDRLDAVVDLTYIGQPYFDPSEVEFLKATVVSVKGQESLKLPELISSTLDERLNRRMKNRVDSGDFRVCAAHDLAPIWEAAFNIHFKKLCKDQKFKRLVDSRGLRGVDEWQETDMSTKSKPKNERK
ncbi:MAG: hypothetical protein M1825_002521 [Sarcosagium campestre]|nr:MAG: hypothetical protein M1825_002521 [Sarcosagium campestre]